MDALDLLIDGRAAATAAPASAVAAFMLRVRRRRFATILEAWRAALEPLDDEGAEA